MQSDDPNDKTSKEANPGSAPVRGKKKPVTVDDDDGVRAERLKVRIRRAEEGDDQELGALYREFSGLIYKASCDICRNREMAEDVVTTTLLKWLAHFGDFTGVRTWSEAQVRRWLVLAATWETYDAIRKHARETPLGTFLSDLAETEVSAGPDSDAELRILSKQVLDDVDDCFRRLARPDQAVMGVRFTGTTREEMAAAILFGNSVHNVRAFEKNGKLLLMGCLLRKNHNLPDFRETSRNHPPQP